MKKIILIIVIAVFILVSGSYCYLGNQERRATGWLVNEGMVRGSALEANGLIYTFNYAQQQSILSAINDSRKIPDSNHPPITSGQIEGVLIYLFNQKDPLKLTPASDDYSLFKVSTWKEPYSLRINQPEDLQIIVELAYDK